MNKKRIVIQEVVLGLMLSLLAILFFDFSTAVVKEKHSDVYCCEVAESEVDAEWSQDWDFDFLPDYGYQHIDYFQINAPQIILENRSEDPGSNRVVSLPIYVQNHQFKYHLSA